MIKCRLIDKRIKGFRGAQIFTEYECQWACVHESGRIEIHIGDNYSVIHNTKYGELVFI